MTPDEAVDARLRQHLAEAPNTVAARARAAAELVDLSGLPVADAREAVAKAFSRIGSNDDAGSHAGQHDSPNVKEEIPAKGSSAVPPAEGTAHMPAPEQRNMHVQATGYQPGPGSENPENRVAHGMNGNRSPGADEYARIVAEKARLASALADLTGIAGGGELPPDVARMVADDTVRAWSRATGEREARRMEAARTAEQVPERPGLTLADFLADAPDDIECVIPGLVPSMSRVIVTAEEGAGKSTLSRYVTTCHAAGLHPFTGERYDGGTAVSIDCENPRPLVQMRLAELTASMPDDARRQAHQRLVVECQPGGIDLASPYWQEYVMRLVGGHKADLVAIGPLYKLCSLKPMSEEFFTEISQFLDRLRTEHGCALWIEAHTRQPVPGQVGRDMFPYGNTGWRRWPETGIFLGGTGMLTDWRGSRYGTDVSWPARLERIPGSQVLWKAAYAAAAATGDGSTAEKFRKIRDAVTADPQISKRELRRAAGDNGTAIQAAINAGIVVYHPAPGRGVKGWWELGSGTPARLDASRMLNADGSNNFAYLYELADRMDWEQAS